MRSKLAIFDMDGTLFDTSEVNYYSYATAANQLGYHICKDKFLSKFVGRNYREFLPSFGICEEKELEFIHTKKKKLYSQYLKYAKKNQALFDLIKVLKTTYKIALATTASRKNVLDIIRKFQVEEYFDIIITQEDVEKLKPNPECYLKAMMLANIKAEDTIIFEDSEIGIQAGLASGANVYKVCNF